LTKYVVALLVSLMAGLLLPHPWGLVLVGAMAPGGLWRLGDRISRLEAAVRDRLGLPEDDPYRATSGYEAEQRRIRARMAQYAGEAKEEEKR